MEGLLGRLGMTRFRRVDGPAGRVAPVGTHVVAVLALVATLLSVVPADTASAQPGQVVNFRITNQISFSATNMTAAFAWNQLTGSTGYKVEFQRRTSACDATTPTWSSTVTKSPTGTSLTLNHQDLARASRYRIRIAGENAGGTGPFTQWIMFDTHYGVPADVSVLPFDQGLRVMWTPLADNGICKPAQYEVKASSASVTVTHPASFADLTGLNNSQTYNVRVKANVAGRWCSVQ